MRKLVLLGVVAAITGGLIAAATGGAQTQGQGQGPGRTIVLHEQGDAGTFRYVDAKPFTRFVRGEPTTVTAGDAFFLRTPLFSNAALTQGAGRLRVHCVATNGARRFDRVTFICDGVYSFRDGTLAVSGLYRAMEGGQTFAIAVVGGTGAYEGANGQSTIAEPAQGNSTHTIHLITG